VTGSGYGCDNGDDGGGDDSGCGDGNGDTNRGSGGDGNTNSSSGGDGCSNAAVSAIVKAMAEMVTATASGAEMAIPEKNCT
jgi:hypothetical protein